ncbi:S-layer homology domain-containing protein [Megasphaera stantonii]|nr:S-layer homology domain-containing protein [Megasphaera stantonii]
MKMKKASRKVLAMMAVTALMSSVSVVGATELGKVTDKPTFEQGLTVGNPNNNYKFNADGNLKANQVNTTADMNAGGNLTAANDQFQVHTDGSVSTTGTITTQGDITGKGGTFNTLKVNGMNVDESITNLEKQVENVGLAADAANDLATQNKDKITSLDDQINNETTGLKQQITNVGLAADAANDLATQNKDKITSLDDQINNETTGLKQQITNAGLAADAANDLALQNKDKITSLDDQINNETTGLKQQITNAGLAADAANDLALQNKDKITSLDDQINNETTGLKQQITNAGLAADAANDLALKNQEAIQTEHDRVTMVEGAVLEVNGKVDKNTAAINTVNNIVGDGVLSNPNASNLTEAVNQNYAQINNNTQAISALDNRVDDLGGEIDQVGAISAALAGLHPLDYDGTGSKFQLSAAMGSYDSTQAAAIGAFYHFNRDVMISLGGATSFDGDHKTAGNLGVTFRIGEGASGKAVSDDVMARLEAMDQKIAALEQENKDLKNVLGTIDTSLSKEFPDVPANHWAYEAVTKLAGNDVVAGYPDGEFHGDRTMTRYEMAEIIYKAMNKGVQVDQKLVNEFKPEMEQVAANERA